MRGSPRRHAHRARPVAALLAACGLLICLAGCASTPRYGAAPGGRRAHERQVDRDDSGTTHEARPGAPDTSVESSAPPPGEDGAWSAPPTAATEKGIPSPQSLQTEAIEACESAEIFLDEGELDDAIAALDRAYQLVLTMPENGDPAAAQTRADIRRIVAEKLIDIYASQRTAAGAPRTSWDLEIQLVANDHVQREIKSFQTSERNFFLDSYRRSGRFRPMILAKLQEAGLPSQLSWLPLIESGYKVHAYSRAKALGLWQFILSTGRRYGLTRDAWTDQRMDPERSTDAAIAYLGELHDLFGDWPQALAGYNCGENRVLRLDRQRSDQDLDFWDLYAQLPRETRRYVPRFFATLLILEDPEAYGIQLPAPDDPLPDPALITTHKQYQLEAIEKRVDLPSGLLGTYNPVLRHGITPKDEFLLRVPPEQHAGVRDCLREMPEYTPPEPEFVVHRVRRGQTLSTIAAKYGVSISTIARANDIRNVNRIYPGRRIKIPLRASAASARRRSSGEPVFHVVRRGDTLWDIAKMYRTSVNTIKRENALRSSRINPGQKLRVSPGSRQGSRVHVVRRGDTLSAIAESYGVGLRALLRINGLSSRSTIYPNQRIVVP